MSPLNFPDEFGVKGRVERDSWKSINFDKLSETERIDLLRDIVSQHQFQKVKSAGHIQTVDVQTANVIVKVYDALNPENKTKYASKPIHIMTNVAWKLVK